jgi:hypothetical protein
MGMLRARGRHDAGGMAMSKLPLIALLVVAACAKSPDPSPQAVTCPDPLAGCRLDAGIEIRFSQTPAVMQAFELEVVAPQGAELHASFQMQGMDMGMNRYRLLQENGKWRAKVMLPACVQGRRDWILRLEVSGKTYEMPFVAG